MKYIILNEATTNGHRFIILPPNNRRQPLGVSPWYPTVDACEKAKRDFAFLVHNEEINHLDDRFVKIESCKNIIANENGKKRRLSKFRFLYYAKDKTLVLYRELWFDKKANCIKCLHSIYNAIIENYFTN